MFLVSGSRWQLSNGAFQRSEERLLHRSAAINLDKPPFFKYCDQGSTRSHTRQRFAPLAVGFLGRPAKAIPSTC